MITNSEKNDSIVEEIPCHPGRANVSHMTDPKWLFRYFMEINVSDSFDCLRKVSGPSFMNSITYLFCRKS